MFKKSETPLEKALNLTKSGEYDICGGRVRADGLRKCFEAGEIYGYELNEIIESMIAFRAKEDYNLILEGRAYADHLSGDEPVLIYALKHDLIKVDKHHKEILLRDCADEFYDSNLISKLKHELFHPKPLPDFEKPCNCCSCLGY